MKATEVIMPFYVLHSSDCPVHHVVFSADGTELLASTKDGELIVWDLSVMRVKQKLKVAEDPCVWASYADESNTCFVHVRGKGLYSVDRTAGKTEKLLNIDHFGYCRPDITSRHIFCPKSDSNVACFDLKSSKLSRTYVPTEFDPGAKLGTLMCLKACEGDGVETVVCGFEGGCVGVFLLKPSGDYVKFCVISATDDPAKILPVITVDFDLVFCRGVIGYPENRLRFFQYNPVSSELSWEAAGGKPWVKLAAPGVTCLRIKSVESKNVEPSSFFVAGTLDHVINVYDWKSSGKAKLLARSVFHKDTIESIAFSCGKIAAWGCYNQVFAASSMDGKISLYDFSA